MLVPLRDDNPTSSFPVLTVSLIAANAIVFIWTAAISPRGLESFILAFTKARRRS
jgi:hypothetical protein